MNMDKLLTTNLLRGICVFSVIVGLSFSNVVAQNAIVGTGFSSGWGGSCPSPGSSNFEYFSASAGTSYISDQLANGTGNQFFRLGIDWSGTTRQITITPGSDTDVSPETEYTLNAACTTAGAMRVTGIGSTTTERYVFKTENAGVSPSNRLIFFKVSAAAVKSVSTVSQSPVAASVNACQAVVVSATPNTAGAASSGQGVYLRYTKDSYATSTIVEMVYNGGTGNYESTIPAAFNTPAANVSYYILTSGDGLTITGAKADWYTINLNNNGGSNYNYTVGTQVVTASDGPWNTGSTWCSGTVPPAGASVTINHNVTVNTSATVANLTVGSAGTLNGGVSTGNIITVNSGGAVTVNAGGAWTTGLCEFRFNGSNTIASPITLYNVDVYGTIAINEDVTFSNSAAILASGGFNVASGKNLTISGILENSSPLVKSGIGTLTLSGTSANTYTGTLTVSAGTITLNKTAGLAATNTLIVSSGATLSTLAANQWGTGTPPLITANGTVNFNNNAQKLALTGTTGAISLGSATVTISNTGTDSYSGSITGTGGLIKEGAGTQTLSGTLSYSGTTTVTTGTLNVANALSSADVVVNGTLTLQSGAVINVNSLTVNGTLNVQSGATLNVNSFGSMVVNGTMNMNGGSLSVPLAFGATISYGAASTLVYAASGTINPGDAWPLASGPNTVQVSGSTTLNLDKNGLSTQVLTIIAFSNFNANTYSFTIAGGGTLTSNGIFNAGTGTLIFAGSATVGGTSARTFYDVETSSGLVNFGTGPGSTIGNSLEILAGGGVVTNKPSYAANSTLIYNTGGNYFSNLEWETTSPAARPHHISVIGGTDLVLDNPYVFECNGDLSISGAGTSVLVDATAGDVGVFGNYSLGTGASMTLSTELGDDLFVRGNWSNTGNFNSNDRAVFFDQGNTQTISGSSDIDFVVVSKSGGSITLQSGASLNIIQGLTTTSNLTVASGGNLTLLSDATTTAWLDNFTGSGNVIGEMTMERFVPGSVTGYHFLSSALDGATINGDLAELSPSGSGQVVPLGTCDPMQTDPSTPYGNIFQLVENATDLVAGCTQDNWFVVSSGTMTRGRGYAANVPVSTTVDVSGDALNGTVTYSGLTNSGGDGDGIHLVGNPFASPIVWSNPAGIEATAYFFETTGSYAGSFDNALAGTGYVIPSMQGFQIRVAGPASATFSVGNADRTTSAAGTFYRTASWYDQMLKLDVSGNGFMDKTQVYFKEGASAAFEPMDNDARKRDSNHNQPTLFTAVDGEQIGINGQAPLAEGPRVIPMGLKPGQNGTFTVSVNMVEGFPASARILLEDLATGTVQDLVQNPSYTFTMTTSEAAERFLLHFVPGATINAIAADCEGSNGQLDVNLGSYSVGSTSIAWDSYRLEHAGAGVIASGIPSGSELSFSGLTAGDYQLVLASGSYEATEALQIEQPLVATAGFEAAGTEFYVGEPVQLLDRSEGSAEYRYDFGDGTILTGEASPAYTYAEAGSYPVSQEVWSTDGCLDQNTQTITVMQRTSSGLDASVSSMAVWTQGLQAYVNVSELHPGAQLVLSDVLGRQIAQTACNQSPCSVTAPAPGAYILSLQSDQEISSRQVILQQ
ncbi:MAG: hypothetical protein GC205_11115 [Bacteroidetes bacterium]|nr:hypothetical protein [Bacteroidota bacterium]